MQDVADIQAGFLTLHALTGWLSPESCRLMVTILLFFRLRLLTGTHQETGLGKNALMRRQQAGCILCELCCTCSPSGSSACFFVRFFCLAFLPVSGFQLPEFCKVSSFCRLSFKPAKKGEAAGMVRASPGNYAKIMLNERTEGTAYEGCLGTATRNKIWRKNR